MHLIETSNNYFYFLQFKKYLKKSYLLKGFFNTNRIKSYLQKLILLPIKNGFFLVFVQLILFLLLNLLQSKYLFRPKVSFLLFFSVSFSKK